MTIQERLRRKKMPIIDISGPYDIGMGVIILWPSRVLYKHQTGGYNCYGPDEEGVFVPLYKEWEDQSNALFEYFYGPKWRGWCGEGIDNETADFIDEVLSRSQLTKFIRTDRTRLKDSQEAWVYVELSEPEEEEDPSAVAISKFGQCKGVLVWMNSD